MLYFILAASELMASFSVLPCMFMPECTQARSLIPVNIPAAGKHLVIPVVSRDIDERTLESDHINVKIPNVRRRSQDVQH
jgi:hypothetical protein